MNDPAFPNRPDHEDFWLLAEVVNEYDAAVDSASSKEEKSKRADAIAANLIDVPSLLYIAEQRAMRVLGIEYASELSRRRDEVTLVAAAYYEAVLVGIDFERRFSGRRL